MNQYLPRHSIFWWLLRDADAHECNRVAEEKEKLHPTNSARVQRHCPASGDLDNLVALERDSDLARLLFQPLQGQYRALSLFRTRLATAARTSDLSDQIDLHSIAHAGSPLEEQQLGRPGQEALPLQCQQAAFRF